MWIEFARFLNTVCWMGVAYSAANLFLITFGRLLEDPFTNLADRIRGRDWPSRGPYVILLVLSATWLVSFGTLSPASSSKEDAHDRP